MPAQMSVLLQARLASGIPSTHVHVQSLVHPIPVPFFMP